MKIVIEKSLFLSPVSHLDQFCCSFLTFSPSLNGTTLQSLEGSLKYISVFSLGCDCVGDHPLKHDLKSHSVCTTKVCHKEFAVAVIGTVIKSHMVIIVVTMKSKIKFVKEEPISFLSVASGLFSFTNHSVVHRVISFQDWNKKSTRTDACLTTEFFLSCRYLLAYDIYLNEFSIFLIKVQVNTQMSYIPESYTNRKVILICGRACRNMLVTVICEQ
jgi:hypothetical protein